MCSEAGTFGATEGFGVADCQLGKSTSDQTDCKQAKSLDRLLKPLYLNTPEMLVCWVELNIFLFQISLGVCLRPFSDTNS